MTSARLSTNSRAMLSYSPWKILSILYVAFDRISKVMLAVRPASRWALILSQSHSTTNVVEQGSDTQKGNSCNMRLNTRSVV